jgi:hypothetical protein
MNKIGARLAAAALAGSVVAASAQLQAFASPASAPTVSIAAKSKLTRVAKATGDVLVVYLDGGFSNAKIGGSVTNGAAGEIAKLYAQQFPFTTPAAPVGTPITLSTTGTSPYSFTDTPAFATRYQVELFASDGTTLLATSSAVTVYVAAFGLPFTGYSQCSRPVCHQTLHFRVLVPPSALHSEMARKWYLYFGLRLSSAGTPPAPKTLRLSAGHARVLSTRKLNGHEYAVTWTYTFSIGDHGYNWLAAVCQRDVEAKDGLNLPGHHGCGNKTIRTNIAYLG